MEAPAGRNQSGSAVELDSLMARYQQADPNAAAELIRQVSPVLYRFLAADRDHKSDIEDMLQETWLQIHRARHTWRPAEPVLPWLYAIARHVKIDGYRKRRRTRLREQTMPVVPDHAASTGGLPPGIPEFDTLVASLPAGQREVVTMLKVSGMSVEEVARATASTAGSVKLKAHRAYTKLRSLLGVAERSSAQRGGQ